MEEAEQRKYSKKIQVVATVNVCIYLFGMAMGGILSAFSYFMRDFVLTKVGGLSLLVLLTACTLEIVLASLTYDDKNSVWLVFNLIAILM